MMEKKQYARVEGHPHLLRDLSNNAIINTDSIASQNYNNLRKRKGIETKRLESIETELSDLKSDINEIKTLLRNLNGS